MDKIRKCGSGMYSAKALIENFYFSRVTGICNKEYVLSPAYHQYGNCMLTDLGKMFAEKVICNLFSQICISQSYRYLRILGIKKGSAL